MSTKNFFDIFKEISKLTISFSESVQNKFKNLFLSQSSFGDLEIDTYQGKYLVQFTLIICKCCGFVWPLAENCPILLGIPLHITGLKV